MKNSIKSIIAIAGVTTSLTAISIPQASAAPTSLYMAASAGYSQNMASMQTVLQELGYYRATVTGKENEETRMAVRAFQKKYGFAASGLVDVDTANKLNEVYYGWNPPTTTAPTPSQLAPRTTQVGYSENIKSIQQILQQLGYSIPADGLPSQQTRDAISSFQAANGLPQTGVVDEQTAIVLNNAYELSLAGQYSPSFQTAESQAVKESVNLLLSPKSMLWTAAGGAAIGGIIAAGAGGGGGGGGGSSASEIDFDIPSNDSGNETYDGTSLKSGFDNPIVGGNPNAFITAETDNNEGIANLKANFAYAKGYEGQVYNRDATGALLNDEFDDYIIVGVIDSGVDSDHPDLVNNLLLDFAQSCTSTSCTSGAEDVDGHGTAVAGVIAAERNSIGTSGIAPQAKILPLKDDLSTAGAIRNYRYANNLGVDIYNNSYGYSRPIVTATTPGDIGTAISESDLRTFLTFNVGGTNFLTEIEKAIQNETLFVWAAGNDSANESDYMAALPYYFDGTIGTANVEGYDWSKYWVNAISVDAANDISVFSNECGITKEWCLAAPGEITSTTDLSGGYAPALGTSFAAPNVSGALAILLGAYPHLSPSQVLSILFETADDLGAVGTDDVYGRGLVNLDKATTPADGDWVIVPASVSTSSLTVANSGINLSSAFGDSIIRNNKEIMFLDRFGKDYRLSLSSLAGAATLSKTAEQRLSEFGRSEFANELNVEGKMQLGFTLDKSGDGINREQVSSYSDYERDGSKMSLQYSAGNTDSSFGYNVSAADVIAFSATSAAAKNHLKTSDAFENPYLGLAERSTTLASEYKLGNVGLRFATFDGETERDKYEFVDSNEVSGYVAEMNLHNQDGLSLSVQSGLTKEGSTFLGSESGGALELSDGSQTYHTGIAASYSPAKDISINANYNYGVTKLDTSRNSLISDISDVKSNSFAIGLIVDNIYAERDSFGLTFSQPLRVSSASGKVRLPQDVAVDGTLLFEDSTLDLTPSGQEMDIEAFYDIGLDAESELSIGSMLRIEPDHIEDATEEGLLLMRYKANF